MINRNVKVFLGDPKLEVPGIPFDSVNIDVSKIYTDINGTIIDKLTLPTNLQKAVPFFMFNELDRLGGLFNFVRNLPAENWKLVYTFIYGMEAPPILFNALMDYLSKIKNGDLIIMYTDDLFNPNYYCFVIVAKNYGSYGTIISNDDFKNSVFIEEISLQTSIEQLRENLLICVYDIFSNVKVTSFLPKDYRRPDWHFGDFVILPLQFTPSKYVGLLHNLAFNTDSMQFSLLFKKRK